MPCFRADRDEDILAWLRQDICPVGLLRESLHLALLALFGKLLIHLNKAKWLPSDLRLRLRDLGLLLELEVLGLLMKELLAVLAKADPDHDKLLDGLEQLVAEAFVSDAQSLLHLLRRQTEE